MAGDSSGSLASGLRDGVVSLRSADDVWVSRFKYRIKLAPAKFKLGVAPCPAHVGEHLNQLWDSNKSPLSI